MKKCAFCDSLKFTRQIEKKSTILNKKRKYYSCKRCGSILQHPYPDKNIIISYYESYFKIKKKMNPGYLEESNIRNFFEERNKTLKELGFMKEWLENGSNVELGCANGHFLRFLNENNARDIIGIDISKSLIKSIKIENTRTLSGDLTMIKNRSIENLFLFNILEHVADIENLFGVIRSKIKRKGRMIIEVPISGIISKLFQKKWRFLMPDEHLNIPSLRGLKILLKKNGFKIIGMTRFGSGFTLGSVNIVVKKILDFIAKKFFIGDRGAFLIISDEE